MSTLVIVDIHARPTLSYSEYISDGRMDEMNNILDVIIQNASDCNRIILLGDVFNSRTNTPEVIRRVTNFIERFDGKEVFILAGNHSKFGTGTSALDYLSEIKNPLWHVIVRDVESHDNMVFCPFFYKSELCTETNEDASKIIMDKIKSKIKSKTKDYILFTHHAISSTAVNSGFLVDSFPEPILPRGEIEQLFKLSLHGHIHAPKVYGSTILAGSVFTNEVGESEKYIWKVNEKTCELVDQILLPNRGIYMVENPDKKSLKDLPKNSIIKAVITKSMEVEQIEEIKKELEKFDAHIIIENIQSKRKKMHYGENESVLEFSVEELLKIYAKQNDVAENKLLEGFELIR